MPSLYPSSYLQSIGELPAGLPGGQPGAMRVSGAKPAFDWQVFTSQPSSFPADNEAYKFLINSGFIFDIDKDKHLRSCFPKEKAIKKENGTCAMIFTLLFMLMIVFIPLFALISSVSLWTTKCKDQSETLSLEALARCAAVFEDFVLPQTSSNSTGTP